MRKTPIRIGIDSNALTYLVDVMNPLYDPEKDYSGLAAERIAILRIYFYGGAPFYVLPTVEEEYSRITDGNKRELHANVHGALTFDYLWEIDDDLLGDLINKNYVYHPTMNDCSVVAEAELGNLEVLLTCDGKLIDRLGSQANTLKLLRPSDYWRELNICPGTKPMMVPHPANPLSKKTWWLM